MGGEFEARNGVREATLPGPLALAIDTTPMKVNHNPPHLGLATTLLRNLMARVTRLSMLVDMALSAAPGRRW